MLSLVQLLLLSVRCAAGFNQLPSLIISNAAMAVVIEKPFFEGKITSKRSNTRRNYERNLERFTKMIENAAEERLAAGAAIEMSVVQDTNINLGNDYTALLSIASCDETWNLFRRAHEEELVHLAITDPDCPRLPITHGISVPIVNPGEELAQMFLDLRMARIFDWKRINLIHDRAFERDTIGRVLRSLSGEIPNNPHLGLASEFLLSSHSADSEHATERSIAETLEKFQAQQRNNGNFLAIVNGDIMPLIAQVARSMGMVHPESRWLYVLPNMTQNSQNLTVFDGLLGEGDNIAFIYNDTNFNRECQQGVECHAREMVGALAGAVQNIFRQEVELYERVTEEEFDAVRMSKPERRRQIISHINAELRQERARDNVAKQCGECVTWRILTGLTWGNSFAGRNKTEPHRSINVGYWTPGPGAFPKDLLFPHSRHGFRNKVLPIVTYHNPPWQYITESRKEGTLKWEGLVFDVVDQLARNLNFTYRLLEMEVAPSVMLDRSDGTLEEKEFVTTITSSGRRMPEAVRELVAEGKVFMAACAYTVTEHLKLSINFTVPISIETYGLLASRPKQLSRVMLFSSPYTTESWACLAGGILLIGPILYLVHKYSPTRADDGPLLNTGLGSPARCLWYIYGALLQQGGMHLPKNNGARLIVGTWWLVVMILVATYSGSLVAFLTFPRMQEKISSIEDLLKHKDDLSWSLPSRSFLEEYLTNGKSDKYDDLLGIAGRPAERHNSTNYGRIVERVKGGKHVLVDWTSSLGKLMRVDNPLTNDGICHFSIGTETFIEESIALLVPPNSAYLRLINNELKKMHESGLIGKWTSDRMTMKDQCWEESGMNRQVDNHKVDVWDMQGIFFVLVLGYLIAFCFLIWEFYAHHRKLSKERNLIRPFIS